MYQLTNTTSIRRLSDNAFIPADERNRDYREYLEWVEAGNEPLPADPVPEPAPAPPSAEQVRAALTGAGLTEEQVAALLAAAAKIKI
jgi:hypothetical protein